MSRTFGSDRAGHDAGAGHAAAASDRTDDHVDIGLGLQDLQRLSGHAGHDERLVCDVDHPVAFLGGESSTVLPGLIEVLAKGDHLRTEPLHGLDLERVGSLRHHDHGLDAEKLSGVCDRLSVVSRRGCGNSRSLLFLGQARDEVDPASNLERTDRLVVLVLHPNLGPQELAKGRV